MVINTNIQAQQTANNLNSSSNALAKSLSRLSSGSKIVTPSDDAAGLAVSSRLTSQMKRLDAAINNVVSAVSFTQTQDGFLKTIDKAFRRMGELAMLAQDPTKSEDDLTLYNQEFVQLREYIDKARGQTFNSVPLFSTDSLAVTIDSNGATFDMTPIDLTKSEYSSSLSVPQTLTNSGILNIARLSGGKIQLEVSASEYAKMATGASVTLSGLTEAYPTSVTTGAKTDLSSLNGTFDVTDAQVLNGSTYIVELDGSSAGTSAIGTPVTWTTSQGVTNVVPPAGSTLNGSNVDVVSSLVATTGIDITSIPRAQAALIRIRNSIDKLAQDRASLGAVQSRLNFTSEQLMVSKENLSGAISNITDTDVAQEATAYARFQILVESGTSMLAQANKMPQSALALLRQ